MKKNTRLFLFVDPRQPLGTYGGKLALEIRKWTEEGWRVRILIPKHVKAGNKRYPKDGYFLFVGKPARLLRETVTEICLQTLK